MRFCLRTILILWGAKKAGSWLILKIMYLVIYGLVSLGRVLNDVTIVEEVKCNETIWLRIRINKRVDLYIRCIDMPNQGNIKRRGTWKKFFLKNKVRSY